jgi:divalent metal cation (Fe/Co/Zn/Cd) transporter
LIVLASIFIIFHAVQNFFNPQPLSDLPLGLGIIISGVIVNWFLGYYIEKEGIKYQSPTLIADGKHLKLDAQSGVILIVPLR